MIENRYAVIGLGRFGQTLALALAGAGKEVVAVDIDQKLVDEIADGVTQAVGLDATNEKALREIGLGEVDVAIVTVGENFEASVLTTMLLKQMAVPRIITRVVSPVQERVIGILGVECIAPERDMAMLLASKLLKPGLVDNIALAEGLSLIQYEAPERWLERTIRDLDLRNRFQCNVVAIKRTVEADVAPGILGDSNALGADPSPGDAEAGKPPAKTIVSVPRPEDEIRKGDVLLILGRNEDIDHLTGEA